MPVLSQAERVEQSVAPAPGLRTFQLPVMQLHTTPENDDSSFLGLDKKNDNET
jgi:hypothetical protein